MAVDRGLLALLEAKPGKGDELADFLRKGRELAAAETGTVTWYAFRISETTSQSISRIVVSTMTSRMRSSDRPWFSASLIL